jgi:hypothetical protein
MLAKDIFGDKYFYGKDDTKVIQCLENRETFFVEKTMRDVFNVATKEDLCKAYFKCQDDFIDVYRNTAKKNETVENRLDKKIIVLYDAAHSELYLARNIYVRLHLADGFGFDDRKNNIAVVLGASGSGKTFFAVKDAMEQAVIKEVASKKMTTKDMKSYVIHLEAGRIKYIDAAEIAKELGRRIKTKLKGVAK